MILYTVTLAVILLVRVVHGHGRLRDPPSRSSMWRDGYNTPKNYNDNELFCGGFNYQYSAASRGRCGVCGDKWDAEVRDNEAGGKYAKGIITRTYDQGATMRVHVEITAHHKGWFEFRICPNNNVTRAVTHECLNRHVLQLADGSGTRFQLGAKKVHYYVDVKLPADVHCEQCVFQWRYHAGNSWGVDPDGTGCLGCGDQEEFYGCADVKILPNSGSAVVRTTSPPVKSTPTESTTLSTTTITTTPTTTQPPIVRNRKHSSGSGSSGSRPEEPTERVCSPVGVWKSVSGMRHWCQTNCDAGYCPPSHCSCSLVTCARYVATGAFDGDTVMDKYCDVKCRLSECPHTLCRCKATPVRRCKATSAYEWIADFHHFCQYICATGDCPQQYCHCQ